MMEKLILLTLILLLGYLSKSQTIMIATVFLIVAVLFQLSDARLETIKSMSIKYGIILITIFAFVPIAKGDITFLTLLRAFINWKAWIAIASGILVTQFAKHGKILMGSEPEITTFVLVGIVIGLLVFKGFPSGPLIGTGISVTMFGIVDYFVKLIGN